MCEILGISSQNEYTANELLDSFFSHGRDHKDGWGLAVFRGAGVTMEKEPVCSLKSQYLQHRLSRKVEAKTIFAHIRRATLGRVEYANCHPFVWDDCSGRTWTLIHNGTLFDGTCTSRFIDVQEGSTDSERILLYLLSLVNDFIVTHGHLPDRNERFRILDDMTVRLSSGNKLNLLIYDGELMYAHTNCPGTLHIWKDDEKCFIATAPIRFEGWQELPRNRLLAFEDGNCVFSGTQHEHVFYDEDHDYESLFSAFSEL